MDRSINLPDRNEVRGVQCLSDPLFNRGTAFTRDERSRFGIEALLPSCIEALDEQAARVLANVRGEPSALGKYRYLSALQASNEMLYCRVVLDHLEELLPVIYTPTVGQACLEWGRIYERPRGLYLSAAQHRGRIASLLRNWPRRRVGIIVVTDGARILGLGDLGANGMGIAISKLSLYSLCAGVPPELCLPVMLDVGTDNEALRNDAFYLGARAPRLTAGPWDAFLDEFIAATQAVFPGAIVHFEGFETASAYRLLARYRDRLCCFNDDVQGTGAMGLAGLYVAGRITGRKLAGQRILFAGAGAACLGIGASVVAAMQREGWSEAEAKQRCLFLDSQGLVVAGRKDLPALKRPIAQDRATVPDLVAAIEDFKPTALIGASGKGRLFSEPVLRAMARLNERPIVFALSNPIPNAECTAEQAYAWTDGRAVFASGSAFGQVAAGGRVHAPGQVNNAFLFPGVGLGLLISGSGRVSDEMFFAAAQALAALIAEADLEQGRILPVVARMREVAAHVAAAVASVAHEQGHATQPRPLDLRAEVARAMYEPR